MMNHSAVSFWTILCVILITGSGSITHAAEASGTVDIRAFLATAINDHQVKYQDEVVAYLDEAPGNTPFIRNLEFRTETDRYNLANQKYSIRYYPTSWGETRRTKELQIATLESCYDERNLVLHQALKWRYLLVLEQLHSQGLLDLKLDLLQLRRDQMEVLSRSTANLDFDIEDLVRAEEQLIDAELEIISLENKQRQLAAEILIWFPPASQLGFTGEELPDVEQVQALLASLSASPAEDCPYLLTSRSRLKLAKAEFNLTKVQDRQFFNFFKATYDHEHHLDTGEALFVELGVRIPIFSSDQIELNRGQLDCYAARADHEELTRRITQDQSELIGDLDRLMEQVALLRKLEADSQQRTGLEAYMQYEGAPPLSLLKLRESLINRDLQLSRLLYSLRIRYIEMLDITGRMSESPLRNWLSREQQLLCPEND